MKELKLDSQLEPISKISDVFPAEYDVLSMEKAKASWGMYWILTLRGRGPMPNFRIFGCPVINRYMSRVDPSLSALPRGEKAVGFISLRPIIPKVQFELSVETMKTLIKHVPRSKMPAMLAPKKKPRAPVVFEKIEPPSKKAKATTKSDPGTSTNLDQVTVDLEAIADPLFDDDEITIFSQSF